MQSNTFLTLKLAHHHPCPERLLRHIGEESFKTGTFIQAAPSILYYNFHIDMTSHIHSKREVVKAITPYTTVNRSRIVQ
ncbi:hypothetical protein ACFLUB_02280 [Chloroflexota bacterium]